MCRDSKGNEIVEEIDEFVKESQDGTALYKKQRSRRKVIDDNTPQIAQAFRQWLYQQD